MRRKPCKRANYTNRYVVGRKRVAIFVYGTLSVKVDCLDALDAATVLRSDTYRRNSVQHVQILPANRNAIPSPDVNQVSVYNRLTVDYRQCNIVACNIDAQVLGRLLAILLGVIHGKRTGSEKRLPEAWSNEGYLARKQSNGHHAVTKGSLNLISSHYKTCRR